MLSKGALIPVAYPVWPFLMVLNCSRQLHNWSPVIVEEAATGMGSISTAADAWLTGAKESVRMLTDPKFEEAVLVCGFWQHPTASRYVSLRHAKLSCTFWLLFLPANLRYITHYTTLQAGA